MEHRSLLVVYVFNFLPNSLSGPPWNEGHRPKVRHETSVFEVPVQEQHEHSFVLVLLLLHLLQVLCTGIAHHRVLQTSGRGWAGSKAVHGMECSGGALALLEVSLSQQGLLPEVYCTASTGRCAHLFDRELTSQRTNNKEPTLGLVPGWYL